MSRARTAGVVAALVMLGAALLLAGCTPPASKPAPPRPKVAPPVVHEAGVLRAGVDLSYPPFGGTAEGRQAGIDVDVASALAGRLGLKVRLVDVKASDIASALADGRIDVGLSAPFSADVLSRATIAGTYLTDAPALFATEASVSVTPTSPVAALDGVKLAAQQDSAAYWRLSGDHGSGAVTTFPSLREAIAALVRGEVAAVGGDALVGAYIARDYPTVRYAGVLSPAEPLGIAVSAENPKLADVVRSTLDSMGADGVLDTIRATWVGDLPKLPTASDETSLPASGITTP